MTLWVDVEDLFDYAHGKQRPSGIQRLAFELSRALWTEYGDTGLVRFVRHDSVRNTFQDVEWSAIEALFGTLSGSEPRSRVLRPTGIAPHSPARQSVRKHVYRLPASLRVHVIETLVAQEHALRAWAGLLGAVARDVARVPGQIARRFQGRAAGPASLEYSAPREISSHEGFATLAAPRDTLLTIGAPWAHPDYAALIGKAREQKGLRYALLVHDIIALRHPEWCDRSVVRLSRAFFDSILPLCDHVFAISQATAADVEAYARERGVMLPEPVMAIPIGTGFEHKRALTPVTRASHLRPPGDYALFVSTIEVRKNHLLLFRVWRRLLREMPPEQVPTLVFAGRVGWLVEDLMQQIANTNNLDGKLMVIENPSDSELVALYQGCRFTLFPSFHEGWGLPVSESLAFGKPCLVADRSSLPEAGGPLARRFDPDNLHDAYAAIRAVIQNPEDLERWAETVRREFRPVPWTKSAEALFNALERPEETDADVVYPGVMSTETADTP